MRLLLDTSTLLWFWLKSDRLTAKAAAAIGQNGNVVFVSPISAMEITTKHRIGKLPGVEHVITTFAASLMADGFIALPLTIEHSLLAGSLPGEHRDPFDRMLAAQAQAEDIAIVSGDPAFDALGARRLW